jgi:hypothetical protein
MNSGNFPPELHEEFMMDPYYIDNIDARCREIIAEHEAMDEVDRSIKLLSDPEYVATLEEAREVHDSITTNKNKWYHTMGPRINSLPPMSYPANVRNIKSSEITLK